MESIAPAELRDRYTELASEAKDHKRTIRQRRARLRMVGIEMAGLRDRLAEFGIELIIEQSEGSAHGSQQETTPA